MSRSRKLRLDDLPAQPDPRTPLDAAAFLSAARPVLANLTADLLHRADADPGIRNALERHHQADLADSRTADDYAVWRRGVVVQVAAAWLLSCVFVRVLEDRGLVGPRIAGPGALDGQSSFFRIAPSLGEREYLWIVFRELTHLAAATALFDPAHNLVWRLGPSAEGCKQLLQLFRSPHPDTPAFRFGQPDTRFLGDLYQDLDDGVRERFALLQTPDFVERFILDRTLEPAIREYGVDDADVIDPTCGSGHFLLGAFERIFDHLRLSHPGLHDRELAARALERIYGVDINPYAVSIARFRLTLRFLERGEYTRLLGAPAPVLHVIVADSLYYGFAGGQGNLGERPHQNREQTAAWYGSKFSLEDPEAARLVLVQRTYAAVVGNPPYITCKDPALREYYRKHYTSASGKYALSAPFMERFFQLAKRGGGYVGQITSSSFTKRDFGAALIEKVLPTVDLELIVNTAGAFIPGHGTPTILIFGRNRSPSGDHVDAVLAKRGEPGVPADPARGHVWRSIVEHWNDQGFEDEYISVARLAVRKLYTLPWVLEGGGAIQLKELIDQRAPTRMEAAADSIGISCVTGEDALFVLPEAAAKRLNVGETRRLITGENLRDWGVSDGDQVLYPYSCDEGTPRPEQELRHKLQYLWPYRALLSSRKKTGAWHELYELSTCKLQTPLTITFAFVSTNNHFILDRGGKVFKQSAPIIKLPNDTGDMPHLALLAHLNSSITCFYIKQITYPKGTSNGDVSKEKGKIENNRHEFSATAVGSLPVPELDKLTPLIPYSRQLEHLQAQRDRLAPHSLIKSALASGEDLAAATARAEREDTALLARMVAVQEDLDWAVYAIFELAPPATSARWTPDLELTSEQRPFKSPAPPGHLGEADRALWHARVEAIAASRDLRLIENPVNKRRWWGARGVFAHKVATFAERVADAAAEQLADLAEQALRVRCERGLPTVFTARDLERELDADPRYQALREFLVARDPRLDPLRDRLERESVPFLAGYRYSSSGRERHARWREVWDLQRIADVSEAALPGLRDAFAVASEAVRLASDQVVAERSKLAGSPARGARTRKTTSSHESAPSPSAPTSPALQAAEARAVAAQAAQSAARDELEWAENHHRKVRKLIPVPSKYEPGDFRSPAYFRLRGKLDVPHERFISYPDAVSAADRLPVYGWAGWNHLQRALALLQLYYHRKLDEGWPPERLVPLLAGLDELFPWVKQWHADERHPDTGERYVDALDTHIAAGCSELGVSRGQLQTWAPPDHRRTRTASPANVNARRAPAPANVMTPDAPLANKARRRPHEAANAPTPDSPPAPTSTTPRDNPPKKRRGRPSKSEIG
ncbi:BREX-2 system adenine-specific DNA-methyltransferase PglX [Nannocystis sp. SCPEA4]|uniref:BREX-2 system adenine-specific DNA-methyltransferase PglX n=1 Tax=Nannocystis sp. SCPEA4 TaxID=2996787 RepID=UPI00226D5683|nr:BREX-2 system adenine-specific DNA-methyltransferase PglX [Nannocystis sp. SCPEA4]MCY1059696.1 BREX-2 system adenine-specific DNA-methyltransferase PglX [Nannocystis sp. SCPEA4]